LNPSAEIPGFKAGDECYTASGGNPRIDYSITRYIVKRKKGAPDFSPGGSTPLRKIPGLQTGDSNLRNGFCFGEGASAFRPRDSTSILRKTNQGIAR